MMNESKIRKIMELLKDKLKFPSDLNGHLYFIQDPDPVMNDNEKVAIERVLRRLKLKQGDTP